MQIGQMRYKIITNKEPHQNLNSKCKERHELKQMFLTQSSITFSKLNSKGKDPLTEENSSSKYSLIKDKCNKKKVISSGTDFLLEDFLPNFTYNIYVFIFTQVARAIHIRIKYISCCLKRVRYL